MATSVDLFNEPAADWWRSDGTQEGCHFSASTQASVLQYLRKELDGRGQSHVRIGAAAPPTRNSYHSYQ